MANKTLAVKVDADVRGADKIKGLGGNLAGVGVQMAKFAAGATAAFVGVGAFTSGFASDLNESLSKVQVVFGDWNEDIVHWSETSAEALGVSQQAALEAAGTFGNLFKAMGFGNEETVDMSTGLVELASDLASFNNLDPTEVLDKLRAGIVGEAEPLRTLGVNINAARTEAKALELGLGGVGRKLTAAEKATANYALIMEDTALAQGDFARTSDGMANQQRILAATFQDTMAVVGQAFVPLIQELLPHVTAGLTAFGGWITSNMPTIKKVMGTVFGAIGTAMSFIFTEVVPRVIEVFSSLFGAVQSNMPSIQEIVSGVFTKIGEVVGWVATNVFPPLVAAFQAVAGWVQANWPMIQTIIGNVFTVIGNVIKFVITDVIPALVAAFSAVVGWVVENWPTISSVVEQVLGAIGNAVKVVWPIVEQIATVLFPAVSAAASVLFKGLDATFKLIGGVFEVLGTVVSTVVDAIKEVWRGLTGYFRHAVKAFEWIGDNIFKPLGDGFSAAIDFIRGIWNAFARFWNSIQITMPTLNIPGIGEIGGFTIGLPDLPFLAHGGIVTKPTLGILGERGPEAVIPLDQLKRLGGDTITVNVNVGGDLKADERTLPGIIVRGLNAAGIP